MLVPRSCPQGWKVAHELQHLPRAQPFPQWWVLFALWSHLETAWNQWKCKATPLLLEKLKWKSQLCCQSVWGLKGLWFPGCFSRLGEFLIFSTRGLPYCKPYSLPEGSDLVGCFLTPQSTACKAPGLSCLPRRWCGTWCSPHASARGCHQCHRNFHQANEAEMEVKESGKCCPEHSESLPKIPQATDNLQRFKYATACK